jgi:hypothetical protein
VDALGLKSSDAVLEIGFGCAYSANHIQSKTPRTHTIIECDQVVLEKARKWAIGKSGVSIVEGIWQEMMSDLGVFDAIFFDDFPVPEAGDLMVSTGSPETDSRWLTFIDLCVNFHMKPGSRITGYLARKIKLERNDCKVTLTDFEVHPPQNCPYFDCKNVFVPLIQYIAAVPNVVPEEPTHKDATESSALTVSGKIRPSRSNCASEEYRPIKRSKLSLPPPKTKQPMHDKKDERGEST